LEQVAPVLTAAEVAKMFRVSVMTIYRLAKAGRIPYFYLGDSLRFDSRALAQRVQKKMSIAA
jgi:excisionase family DNA binding protein